MDIERHTGERTPCEKCGRIIDRYDLVIYSWDAMSVYHPECINKKYDGKGEGR